MLEPQCWDRYAVIGRKSVSARLAWGTVAGKWLAHCSSRRTQFGLGRWLSKLMLCYAGKRYNLLLHQVGSSPRLWQQSAAGPHSNSLHAQLVSWTVTLPVFQWA